MLHCIQFDNVFFAIIRMLSLSVAQAGLFGPILSAGVCAQWNGGLFPNF